MNRAKFFVLGAVLTLAACWMFWFGLQRWNPYIFMIPVLLPPLVMGISRPDWIFLSALAILYSKLVIPGLPGELELMHLLLVFVGMVLFFRWFITKEHMESDAILRFAALGYGVVVFYTMLVRGIGFRVLGSGQAGGMRYVLVFIGILTVCLVPNIRVSRIALKRALILSALLSFLPVLAEGILLATGGRVYQQYNFLQAGFGLGMTLMDMSEGSDVRFMSASILGRGLVYFPFFVFPLVKRHAWKYALFILVGLGVGALSGFRSVLISNVLFVFIYGFLLVKGHRKAYLLSCLGAGLAGYLLLFMLYDFLPFGIQRSLSFLPFLGYGSEALRDANSTIDFRFEVWRLAVKEIPEYLLLGRGMAFDLNEFNAVQQSLWMWDRIFVRGLIANLHNGPLEVLIYLGLPGILFFVTFLIRGWKVAQQRLQNSQMTEEGIRLTMIFTSLFMATTVLFLASFGNPYSSFLNLCLYLTLIQIISRDQNKGIPLEDEETSDS